MSKYPWPKWTSRASEIASIAGVLGVPTVSSLVAGWWSNKNPGVVSIGLIMLLTFLGVLWCCIGFLWLKDRNTPSSPISTLTVRDCGWGFALAGLMLNHDPNHKEIAWQIKFQFANTLSWPVRLNIEEIRVVIENMAPDLPSLNMGSAFIIPGKSKAMWSSGGYSKEFFKIKDIMNGKVYISYKYGHPDDGYSRMATKELSIECNMRGMALEFGGPVAIGVTPSIEADTPIA